MMAAHTRRSKLVPDMFVMTSDIPIGWGVIEAIDGDKVTVRAPEMRVFLSAAFRPSHWIRTSM